MCITLAYRANDSCHFSIRQSLPYCQRFISLVRGHYCDNATFAGKIHGIITEHFTD